MTKRQIDQARASRLSNDFHPAGIDQAASEEAVRMTPDQGLAEATDPAALEVPADAQALLDAAVLYARTRAKLPAPGKEFHGPDDARNFQEYFVALLALERAAMSHAGRRIQQ